MENKLEMSFIMFALICLLFGFIGWYYGQKRGCVDYFYTNSGDPFDPNNPNVNTTNNTNGSNVVLRDDNTIYGCTDPNAINYYGGAAADDGSCVYSV